MDDDPFFADLEKGIQLFNRREFFEAHEVWEDRWNEEAGDPRRFLQGLIQIAAGLLKIQTGTPTGAMKLLGAGSEKLRPLGGAYCGVDLNAILAEAAKWKEAAEKMLATGSTDYDPASLPRIAYQRPGKGANG